ncbi:MAG TPA: proteasome-activating nucleotidase [archaeon]|nr:proteasome-activating nucleotidase [archaeon]
MPEANETKRPGTYDVYDYVFSIEEQLRSLQTEKQITSARLTQIQLELERTKREINELKMPPLIVGTIHEVLPDGSVIVKHSNGMEFLVKPMVGLESELESGKRVAMNQRSLVITNVFPENKDWRVSAMEVIEKPKVTFEQIGGLEKEIVELEEAVILPLTQPESFERLGIDPPNGVLLHGMPGTGKTLLAKAVANKTNSTFISLSGAELVRKYIGEGAKLVRDLFKMAKEKKPAIIFIDEIDAVGSHRFATANGDREVQRTLMQLLAEMDGFNEVKGVKVIAATNRLDMLDNALLRPGRFDRIIEVRLPSKEARKKIFEIHAARMSMDKAIDLNELADLTEGFTGADIKNACTEAGMMAMRKSKKKIDFKDFNEAIQKTTKQPVDMDKSNERMFA